MSVADTAVALDNAREAYHHAAGTLAQAAEQFISATIADAFPGVTEVTVEGEYNEDSEIRVSLAAPDGVDEVGWETTIEGLEGALFELVSVTGEDWLGINTLHVTT